MLRIVSISKNSLVVMFLASTCMRMLTSGDIGVIGSGVGGESLEGVGTASRGEDVDRLLLGYFLEGVLRKDDNLSSQSSDFVLRRGGALSS